MFGFISYAIGINWVSSFDNLFDNSNQIENKNNKQKQSTKRSCVIAKNKIFHNLVRIDDSHYLHWKICVFSHFDLTWEPSKSYKEKRILQTKSNKSNLINNYTQLQSLLSIRALRAIVWERSTFPWNQERNIQCYFSFWSRSRTQSKRQFNSYCFVYM